MIKKNIAKYLLGTDNIDKAEEIEVAVADVDVKEVYRSRGRSNCRNR